MKRVANPPRLPARPKDANKVTVGRVLVVGGSPELRGAPALAALGALRAGAGLVKVAVPQSVQATVAGYRPETTTVGLPETRSGAIGASALPVLRAFVDDWDAVVLGPGAGRAKATLTAIRTFTREKKPFVIDADALFAWNHQLMRLRQRRNPTVLTPHEGEAARLLGTTSDEVRADRRGAAAAIAEKSGGVCVLKGPATLVTDGTHLYTNKTGGPVLATGGTGDVLAGVIGAFLGQGMEPFKAACAGAHVHGDGAERTSGAYDRGLLASDLAEGIPGAIHALRRGVKA